jgi:hypothetical protein
MSAILTLLSVQFAVIGFGGIDLLQAQERQISGIWVSDGYGLVLHIDANSMRAFQITAISCLPSWTASRRPEAPKGVEAVFLMRDSPMRILVTEGSSSDTRNFRIPESAASTILFRRAQRLAEICSKAPENSPLSNFDIFWTTFDEHYPFFQVRGVDWKKMRDKYRPQISPTTTNAELYNILRAMLLPLRDGHTHLQGKGFSSFIGSRPDPHPLHDSDLRRVWEIIETRYLHGQVRSWCLDKIKFGLLSHDVAYLRILGFGAYTEDHDFEHGLHALEEALDAVFRATPGVHNLVMDIRINRGGSDLQGLAVASRLATKEYSAYFKKARNDRLDASRFTAPQESRVASSTRPHFGGRVILLTSRYTISAGETFTMALTGRTPAIQRIGENTQGIFSDILWRDLPNGWSFGLPNEVFETSGGTSFEGAGIPSDMSVPVFTKEDLAARRDSALDKCLDLFTK